MKIAAPRGKRILSNLSLIYPESSEAWRKGLRRRLYEHLSWMVTEICVLQRDPLQVSGWIEEIQGECHIGKLLAEGKGALFLSGHYGNWELLAAWYAQYLSKRGIPFYIVSQSTRDKDVARLIARYRQNMGIKLLPKSTSTLEMVKLLK